MFLVILSLRKKLHEEALKWSPIGPEIIKDGSSSENEELENAIKESQETANTNETSEKISELPPIPETPSRPNSTTGKKKRKRRTRDYDWNTKRRKTQRRSGAA